MLDTIQTARKLPEIVADRLRDMIIQDSLAPGDRMPTEGELVGRFGVSRSTIREAAKLLQAERVLEIRRGQGTFVADNPGIGNDPLGLRFADQSMLLFSLMEVRSLIEPGTAALAAQRRTDEDLREMHDLIEMMDAAYRRKEDYAPFDIRFHTAIANCTHNDVLRRLLPVINESILTGYSQTVHVEGSYARASQCHSKLFMAIAARDPEEARRVAERHIQQTLNDSQTQQTKSGGEK